MTTATNENPGVALPGLDGTNPLGLFAAIGCAQAVDRLGGQGHLSWSTGPIPTAHITGVADADELVSLIMADLNEWRQCWLLSSSGHDDVKFQPDELRAFLRDSRQDERSLALATALVTEGVVDGKGAAKPTDFHFTAGRQLFLAMARKIVTGVGEDDIRRAIFGRWEYASKLPSLMWDTADDRLYALSALDPASNTKQTEPGVECLALGGMSVFTVTAGRERTLTPGCSGNWKKGKFRWPLWSQPLRAPSAIALIGSSVLSGKPAGPRLAGLGIDRLVESDIRRNDQGGSGTFGPPRVLWQRQPG